MSLFRLPMLPSIASTMKSIRGAFSNRTNRSVSDKVFRRLLVDPLEERQLLSLSPADMSDLLVNRSVTGISTDDYVGGVEYTDAQQAIAVDNDGDFVAAWTRQEVYRVRDAHGNLVPVPDPETGENLLDSNIYARYFTDEVQRVTLPQQVLAETAGRYGTFSLDYGYEIQKITISATYEPFTYVQEDIVGRFQLSFLEGTTQHLTGEIFFDETASLRDNAVAIQNELNTVPGLNDVWVEAVSPREYLVHWGEAQTGQDKSQLEWVNQESATFSSGFLPAVTIETVRNPVTITNIPISPDNPELTARAIEDWFAQTAVNFDLAPIDFPPENRVGVGLPPYTEPIQARAPIPSVSVTPVLTTVNPDVQVLTFDTNGAASPVGNFRLGFDLNGDGSIDASETTIDIAFNSTSASALQGVADGIQAELEVFYPGVKVSVGSGDNPFSFQIAFKQGTVPKLAEYLEGTVAPLDLVEDPTIDFDRIEAGTVFDITFTGTGAKKNHPLMVVSSVKDEFGNETIIPGDHTATALKDLALVTTQKETSDEFQVNPIEVDNPFTFLPDVYDQTQPVVAIDSDGEFVIAWKSEVPNSDNFGSFSDIFSRHFAAVGSLAQFTDLTLPGGGDNPDYDANFADNQGLITPSVRALVTPEAQITQLIEFDGPTTPGTFKLQIGDNTTATIAFNGTDAANVDQVAGNITVALNEAGYQNVLVTVDSYSDPYTFRVNYEPTFGTNLGKDRVTIQVVEADSLGATITVTDETEDFYTFRVNQATANPQFDPTVAMDEVGNFVIGWANGGQDISFFNGIKTQQFDRDGVRIGSEFLVNREDTAIHHHPYVAVNYDGIFMVTWAQTVDPDYLDEAPYLSSIYAKVFDASGEVLVPQFNAPGAGKPSAAFDMEHKYIISWQIIADNDNSGETSTGVYAKMYKLFDVNGNVYDYPEGGGPGGETDEPQAVARDLFRINSATIFPVQHPDDDVPDDPNTLWPLWQYNAEAALDADGDLVVTYQGYGADSSENVFMEGSYFEDWANVVFDDPTHFPEDYFDPQTDWLWAGFSNGDVDGAIDSVLIQAQIDGATNAEVAQLRAYLDMQAGLLRGEAHGALFSRWDTDPLGTLDTLYSDSVLNAQRDGHNTRYFLEIAQAVDGGSFELNVLGEVVDVQIPNPMNPVTLRDNIHDALEGAAVTGINWPEDAYRGGVVVRLVGSQEVIDRQGTDWELERYPGSGIQVESNSYVYDITFQGEVHDMFVPLSVETSDLTQGGNPAPAPWVVMHTAGDMGTWQMDVSISMEPDGDFTTVWTQYEEYTSGDFSNENIYYRRFDEITDTAGPRIGDLVDSEGDRVTSTEFVDGPVRYLVLTFDEEMMAGDPATNPDSILNPKNFKLFRGDVEIPNAIANVEFGMNMAAELAGKFDGLTHVNSQTGAPETGIYDLDPVPTNKWEAVLVLDGNGGFEDLITDLGRGDYTVRAVAPQAASGTAPATNGLRDKAGNALAYTGFMPGGANLTRSFRVAVGESDTAMSTGRTHPETPSAVAVDGDGDHVVAWTQDDRIYVQLFDAYGNAKNSAFAVTPALGNPEFVGDVQRYASVACDKDGDFIVTWTNDRNGEIDIYARRFNSDGTDYVNPATGVADGPFVVNTYTAGTQQWSNVAMDVDGDVVITWSSQGQEDNGQMGTGWGVYARQYDSLGQPLAPEFRVNVTTVGDQQGSSVAMAADGEFVIVWTSDQDGTGDDIFAREFFSDGSPKDGPLAGEMRINDYSVGNQRYPDVAMGLDGKTYVVTWTDSAADISGSSVWYELSRALPHRYNDPLGHFISGRHEFTIQVGDNFVIEDLEIHLEHLRHARLEDLRVSLRSPSGTEVLLFEDLPRLYRNGTRPSGNELIDTTFDDHAPNNLRITESDMGAIPPYSGYYVPQQQLSAFDGENSQGTWTLIVHDREDNGLTGWMYASLLGSWWLDISEVDREANSDRVNTTTEANQLYSSVAMDHDGNFVISWCGTGQQQYQEDEDGYGVFYQRYDDVGRWIGGETRVNIDTEGNQWIPSVGSDAEGNFVVAWTGVNDPVGSSIYTFVSRQYVPVTDATGPIVTDVLVGGERLLAGDLLDSSSVNQLVVVFDENLMISGGTTGLHSVLNPSNWMLERDGSEIPGIIADVAFSENATTGKWEAVLTLDSDGMDNGLNSPLTSGDYVLTVRDNISDRSVYFDPDADDPDDSFCVGNALDGDFDGIPGSSPITVGFSGYQHQFTVAGSAQLGAEYRINPDGTKQYEQEFEEGSGTGNALEESTRSIAVDNDGDYVVVWTSYGQDDSGDPTSAGVYFSMYDRNGVELQGETLVNTTVGGDQRNAAVAIDADGEFIIVWESQGQDPDGSWGVYGQRYSSTGVALGDEFRVNSEYTNNQLNPAVAIDDWGNFVVVWATAGQDFSFFNDVWAQRYNYLGEAQGVEFLVNSNDSPGTNPAPAGGFEVNPTVVMRGSTGDFVVAWDLAVAQQNGVVTNTNVIARAFNADGTAAGTEFRADTGVGTGGTATQRTARNPQLAMDDLGNYVLVWESYVNPGYDIFYQQFNANGTATNSGQANQVVFGQDQVNPSVAMDADGDFTIAWNGFGGQPDPLNPTNPDLVGDHDTEGVFIRKYHAASGAVTVQMRVNQTESGIQQFPTVAMEPDGDIIVAWSGRGIGDYHGIFARKYDEPTDTAGPTVTDVTNAAGDRLIANVPLTTSTQYLVMTFDEDMLAGDPALVADSILNPDNFRLSMNGIELPGGIFQIEFGLNQAANSPPAYGLNPVPTNKWEAVILLDGDATTPGVQPLEDARYTIEAIAPVLGVNSGLRDAEGNPLYRAGYLPTGRSFFQDFGVQVNDPPVPPVPPEPPIENPQVAPLDTYSVIIDGSGIGVGNQVTTGGSSIAVDNDGDFVITWTRHDEYTDADGNTVVDANVYARYFTDEVQRLTLPGDLAVDNDVNALGMFQLAYKASELQKLTIDAGVEPYHTGELITGGFMLGFDANGDGDTDDLQERVSVAGFSEADPVGNAELIQTALRGLASVAGGDSSQITVSAANPRDFLIDFGVAGIDQPEIVMESATFLTGYYPAAMVSTERESFVVTDIMVSPDDPTLTAAGIQNAFEKNVEIYSVGPVDFPPANRINGAEAPYTAPWRVQAKATEVSVVPVTNPDGTLSLTQFDITFTGTAGMQNHPELDLINLTDESGAAVVPGPDDGVETRKEPSDTFRVNPDEPDNPFTPELDVLDQTRPAVAMDADGDFIITWQSEVSNADVFGSISDIFAKRYSPFGKVDAGVTVPGEVLDVNGNSAGVRELVSSEAVDAQRLTFENTIVTPLIGDFKLKIGADTTGPISFNSSDLAVTAADIEDSLEAVGYSDVIVSVVSTATPGRYRLDVYFAGDSGGVDQPLMQIVDSAFPAATTFDVADKDVDLYTLRVNIDTANPQFDPDVAIDEQGNFVIVWANGGQEVSYFNHISMQRFNRDGERVGNAFQVNRETTNIQFEPDVAISPEGNYAITWGATDDPNYIDNGASVSSTVQAKVFDNGGIQFWDEFNVGDGGFSSAAFDSGSNLIITWEGPFDADNGTGALSDGIHGRQFAMFDDGGVANPTPVDTRPEFRINSSSVNSNSSTLWPMDQGGAQPALDADGDLVVVYEGYGPDVSVNVNMASGYFTEHFPSYSAVNPKTGQLGTYYENHDLLPYFNPLGVITDENGFLEPGSTTQEALPVLGSDLVKTGDVNGVIDEVIYRAKEQPDFIAQQRLTWERSDIEAATDEQLGRLRAILESEAGLLRGEGNGILLSRWDADPELGLVSPLYSDSVSNSYRDGQNQRYFIEIPVVGGLQVEAGSFFVTVTNTVTGLFDEVLVQVTGGGAFAHIDYAGMAAAIEIGMDTTFGGIWPDGGAVDVREVTPDEINMLVGTPWEITDVDPNDYIERTGGMLGTPGYRNALYEVTFQGAIHDVEMSISSFRTIDPGGPPPSAPGEYAYAFPTIVGVDWTLAPGPAAMAGEYEGQQGTPQIAPGIGMEPDGDFVTVYTQQDVFSNGLRYDDPVAQNYEAPTSVYYRRYDEQTDTAGPRVSDWTDADGTPLEDGVLLRKSVDTFVLTFDEEMLGGNPAETPDSVFNPDNYRLYLEGEEVPGAVVSVDYGMSIAATLSAEINPHTGLPYDTNPIPSNKWEAVLTLDGDPTTPGVQPLGEGRWTIEAVAASPASQGTSGHAGLRDKAGNVLYHTGFVPDGEDFSRDFQIKIVEQQDRPITPSYPNPWVDGHTYPQTPGAVAADADGDHVVVWTATDDQVGSPNRGLERIYVALFDAEGNPQSAAQEVTLGLFAGDEQRYASVACDKDGDYIITWTNYHEVSPGNVEIDVYARRFYANGELMPNGAVGSTDPFRLNSYTTNEQIWSNAAMDVDGDFVVTWSSLGQEDNQQMGTGYGVYARRYDSYGQPLGSEFLVNVTTTGDQRFSNVAMDSEGGFVIAWTSGHSGNDDIMVRSFKADGSVEQGPLGGEMRVNETTIGDQRYPDIAMNLSGDQFAVSWSASGQDGSGWGVYSRVFNRSTSTLFVPSTDVGTDIPDVGSLVSVLDVSNNSIITDLNIQLEIRHSSPADLEVHLVSPDGTDVLLFNEVPRRYTSNDARPQGSDLFGTTLDDEATLNITDSDNGAVPPFSGYYIPEEALSAFDGENVNGQWQLRIEDKNGNDQSGSLERWSIVVDRAPADGQEFRVNTTSINDQTYSSVAMDHQGGFVVTWSGYGNQPDHADESGSGVFYQRFEPTGVTIGGETRVNMTTEGDQWIPSIASNGRGDFYIAFTGVQKDANGVAIPDETDVYLYASNFNIVAKDHDGPIVTDVVLPGVNPAAPNDRTRVLQGDLVPDATDKLIVIFSETMEGDSPTGATSVLNPNNWILNRNGAELINAISEVEFELNTATRKYEATLTFTDPLESGDYSLIVSEVMGDGVNNLDGDRDGIPQTNPENSSQPGYQFDFAVIGSGGPQTGSEYLVNPVDSVKYEQQFSTTYGTGVGYEQSAQTLAVDHDGDYVVVWTSFGQDDPNDASGAGVYFRMYDRNDNPVAGGLVNTTTVGDQRNASVAIDADGDFVVVWESQDASGNWDVYARRFNSAGNPVVSDVDRDGAITALDNDGEFLVNTDEALNQLNPSVAMDNFGNFTVVWATAGNSLSFFNDVHGQMFDYAGRTFDEQFQVNAVSVPGTNLPVESDEVNPFISMDPDGNFVVAWDVTSTQSNGIITDTNVMARLFDVNGAPIVNVDTGSDVEFQVNVSDSDFTSDSTHDPKEDAVGGNTNLLARTARNPQIVTSNDGNFIVVWESYQDNDLDGVAGPDSYGIYLRRFEADGTPVTDVDQQANLVITSDDVDLDTSINSDKFADAQVNPSIAIDANGDFAVVWSGNGAEPNGLDPTDPQFVSSYDSDGVFLRRFNSVGSYVSTQSLVNTTTAGVQQFPSIGMTADGDMIVAWSGRGIGDQHGIFARRYESSTDTVGPLVTGLMTNPANPADRLMVQGNEWTIFDNPLSMVVVFDEDMSTVGGVNGDHSVTNPNNWTLLDADGQELQGTIHDVQFQLNTTTNKYEATVWFDGNGSDGGFNRSPLPNGTYALVARSTLQDVSGNALAQTGLLPKGVGQQPDGSDPTWPGTSPTGGLGAIFRVHELSPGTPSDGDIDPSANIYSVEGLFQGELTWAYQYGHQNDPSVARVANGPLAGSYVAVWVDFTPVPGIDGDGNPVFDAEGNPAVDLTNPVFQADIVAQRFDAFSRPSGDMIEVNSIFAGHQFEPDVAIDDQGEFVITWSGNGDALGDDSGVFAQRYAADGTPVAGQFRVNQWRDDIQDEPVVAMDAAGNFVIAWTSYGQDGDRDGVFARRYNNNGQPVGNEFQVNNTWRGLQESPDVAMDAAGNFTVVWTSDDQDGSAWGVFAQRFDAVGVEVGGEFRVNRYTTDKQITPRIAMDVVGNSVVTWASFMQDGSGYGIYAQRYDATGSTQGTEFRVNDTALDWQTEPSVGMGGKGLNGAFVITWTTYGQEDDTVEINESYAIFAHMYEGDGSEYIDLTTGLPLGEFRVNAIIEGDQISSDVSAIDDQGNCVVVWVGPDASGTGIYSRMMDPPLDEEPVTEPPTSLALEGTAGDDKVYIVPGATAGSWVVVINGASHAIAAETTSVSFDGLGGNDTVMITGSSADETVELLPNAGTFTSNGFTVSLTGVYAIVVDGGGGNDTAVLRDSDGNDIFDATPATAKLYGDGFFNRVTGFGHVHAYASLGDDVAKLYDSAGDDTFVGTDESAKMYGDGFYNRAKNFRYVHAYSTLGDDVAELYDSIKNDTLVTTPEESKLYGRWFYNRAVGFRYVHAHASVGTDVAKMYDSAGDDTFVGTPEEAKLYGEEFFNRAKGFRYVHAYASAGVDVAKLYDSAGDDTLVAKPDATKFYGEEFYNRAKGFRYVHAYSSAGVDVAKMFDSEGADIFVGAEDASRLYGDDFYNRAVGFRYVHAFALAGGADSARLSGSAGNDIFSATPESARYYGEEFYNRTKGFESVHANGTPGGKDKAYLYDSALNDLLAAGDNWASVSNAELQFSNLASDFAKVKAFSSNSGDVKDAALATDALIALGLWEDI